MNNERMIPNKKYRLFLLGSIASLYFASVCKKKRVNASFFYDIKKNCLIFCCIKPWVDFDDEVIEYTVYVDVERFDGVDECNLQFTNQ